MSTPIDHRRLCFVVMGFGVKRDYATQRDLDLDRTYEHLVRPAAEEAGLSCLRGDEVAVGGVIDRVLYGLLLRAAVVVADLSTANPNAMYELGVRHGLRPRSTILIAERDLVLPFDLSHVSVLKYEHLGRDIGVSEARRFTAVLGERIRAAVADIGPDSPVYVSLPELTPPAASASLSRTGPDMPDGPSLREHLAAGEEALARGDHGAALEAFESARAASPLDVYVVRRVVEAHLGLTRASGSEEHLAAAADLLAGALRAAPADADLLALRADLEELWFERSQAPEHLDEAVRARERVAAITDSPAAALAYARALDRRARLQRGSEALDAMLAVALRTRVAGASEEPAEIAEALIALGRVDEGRALLDGRPPTSGAGS